MSACDPPQAPGPVCVRGTVGCRQTHDEPTLLEQLDAAEAQLRTLTASQPPSAYYPGVIGDWMAKQAELNAQHTAAINAASAQCMAAAARLLVTTEDISDGPVPPAAATPCRCRESGADPCAPGLRCAHAHECCQRLGSSA